MTRISLIGVVGPTGAGKSQLALTLATDLSGEIIAADSRTVYRGLTIGTAKPTAVDCQRVRHHLLDVVGPEDSFSVAEFQRLSQSAWSDINRRGHYVVLAGGSGLYVDSLLWGYQFSDAPANLEKRQQLNRLSVGQLQRVVEQRGLPRPENWQNKRYLVRTLERERADSSPPKLKPGVIVVGLNPPPATLKDIQQQRWEAMLAAGVVDEAKWAWQTYPPGSEALKGNIYQSLRPYLQGKMSLAEARTDFLRRDWQLARRQLTWWRRRAEIQWFVDRSGAAAYVKSQVKPVIEP